MFNNIWVTGILRAKHLEERKGGLHVQRGMGPPLPYPLVLPCSSFGGSCQGEKKTALLAIQLDRDRGGENGKYTVCITRVQIGLLVRNMLSSQESILHSPPTLHGLEGSQLHRLRASPGHSEEL